MVLTAVLAASLSSFSGAAAADDRPDSDRKKGGRDANPAEAAVESPEGEAKEAAPPPAEPTDDAVPPAAVPAVATTTDRLKARSGPSIDDPAVRTLDEGTAVDITCQTQGGDVEGSSTWYQLTDGTFVSAAFISTPGGANSAPQCGVSQTAGDTAEVLASIDEAPPADAPGQRAAEAGAPAAAADSVLFVVDTSGSMGGPKLDQAKVALREGIASLTNAQAAGLRNFPAPGFCDAGQLLVPIATDNRAALQTAVNGLVASGNTPTAAALRAAVADLPSNGTRTIVLISDGEANCGGDPCVAARDLVASGVKFTVQAVGFNVSGAAPAQLQCIADATGGRYFEATDGAGLAEAIKGAIPGGKDTLKYVALGDSYSAGEGVPPYFKPRSKCHRSEHAYPTMVRLPEQEDTWFDLSQDPSNETEWGFQACSGATTRDVLRATGRHGEPLAQVDDQRSSDPNSHDLPLDEDTDLVTITIGGNDIEFEKVLTFCAVNIACHNASLDGKPYERGLKSRIDGLRSELNDVYETILAKAPNARVLVLGYPQIFPRENRMQCRSLRQRVFPVLDRSGFLPSVKVLSFGYSVMEQQMLRRTGMQLDKAIAEEVTRVGSSRLSFISVAQHFAGHEVCGEKGEWIHGLSFTPDGRERFIASRTFHPNRTGQANYAECINAYFLGTGRPCQALKV
ncbi:MAG TPA: GDSL-type esterase/lipase family protein [Acidimicrobiales bacterium]|nr:GDSL-type esterase/lipase family protein [Acidimicrobiales bacterium]